jgi:hypothetical protein
MAERKEEEYSKISRRKFLKDAGLLVGGATVGSMAIMGACSGGDTKIVTNTVTTTNTKTVRSGGTSTVTVTPPGTTVTVPDGVSAASNTINLTINGNKYKVAVEPQWILDICCMT